MTEQSSIKLPKNQSGLTLTELLVSISIASIIIVSLISILFTQYGSILAESRRADLRTSGQALLIALQDELLFTIEYVHSLHVDLVDDHAPSGGWTYDTSPATLIIYEIALDAARGDDNRNIIRQRLTNCEDSQITDNTVAINNIIYFIEENPDSPYKKLIRRTVTPTHAICSIDRATGNPCTPVSSTCLPNARETTCPEAFVGMGGCAKRDAILSENVLDFSIRYFELNNVETAFPSAAQKIELSLVLGDKVFGRDVTVEVNHTIRKIN